MRVAEIITQLKSSEKVNELTPQELGNYLLVLSAYINEAGMNVLEAEKKYSEGWIIKREETESDKQADIAMKITQDYHNWRSAIYAEKALIESIRSLKKVIAIKQYESQNQF